MQGLWVYPSLSLSLSQNSLCLPLSDLLLSQCACVMYCKHTWMRTCAPYVIVQTFTFLENTFVHVATMHSFTISPMCMLGAYVIFTSNNCWLSDRITRMSALQRTPTSAHMHNRPYNPCRSANQLATLSDPRGAMLHYAHWVYEPVPRIPGHKFSPSSTRWNL